MYMFIHEYLILQKKHYLFTVLLAMQVIYQSLNNLALKFCWILRIVEMNWICKSELKKKNF